MNNLLKKAENVKLLILDVDGVLTDGKIYYTNTGDELKAFDIQDGLGLKLLLDAGVEIAIITGRSSKIVEQRMQELGIKHYYQGEKNKIIRYEELKKVLHLSDNDIAMVGDDLLDLPLIQKAGFGITVANAVSGMTNYADWQTAKSGGNGAVREICELILTAQNKWPRFNA